MWLRIDQQEGAPLLQHVEDGAPEHARTFHGDMRHLVETQPVTQCQEICRHGPKGAHDPADRTIRVGQQHAGHNSWIQYLHPDCSFLGGQREVRGKHQFRLRARPSTRGNSHPYGNAPGSAS